MINIILKLIKKIYYLILILKKYLWIDKEFFLIVYTTNLQYKKYCKN